MIPYLFLWRGYEVPAGGCTLITTNCSLMNMNFFMFLKRSPALPAELFLEEGGVNRTFCGRINIPIVNLADYAKKIPAGQIIAYLHISTFSLDHWSFMLRSVADNNDYNVFSRIIQKKQKFNSIQLHLSNRNYYLLLHLQVSFTFYHVYYLLKCHTKFIEMRFQSQEPTLTWTDMHASCFFSRFTLVPLPPSKQWIVNREVE